MILDGDDIHSAYFCAAEVLRARHQAGRPVPPEIRRFYDRLDIAINCMSPAGHEIDSDETPLNPDDWITNREAATILNRSPRQTRRIASDFGARIIGGRLLFPRGAVETYALETEKSA